MTVNISPSIHDNEYLINQKRAWQDMSGNWIANPELNDAEKQFFKEYLRTKERTVGSRSIEATYKL